MDFRFSLSNRWRSMVGWPGWCSRQKKECKRNWYDYYSYKIQSIVVWENPTHTLSALLLLNLVFWLMVNMCWKFYGILFTALLIFSTHRVWTEKIWPEMIPNEAAANVIQHNPMIMTTDEIHEYVNKIVIHVKMGFIRLKNLRSENPFQFCTTMSFCFGVLYTIGSTISGIWLIYSLLMALLLLPGACIHIIPAYVKRELQYWITVAQNIFDTIFFDDNNEADLLTPPDAELDKAYKNIIGSSSMVREGTPFNDEAFVPKGIRAMPSFDDTSVDGFEKGSNFMDDKMSVDSSDTSSVNSDFINLKGSQLENMDDDRSEDDFLPDYETAVGSPLYASAQPFARSGLDRDGNGSHRPVTRTATDDEFEIIDQNDLE